MSGDVERESSAVFMWSPLPGVILRGTAISGGGHTLEMWLTPPGRYVMTMMPDLRLEDLAEDVTGEEVTA